MNQTCCAVIGLVHVISLDGDFLSMMTISYNNIKQDKMLPCHFLRGFHSPVLMLSPSISKAKTEIEISYSI
jgi:hypothetical protein